VVNFFIIKYNNNGKRVQRVGGLEPNPRWLKGAGFTKLRNTSQLVDSGLARLCCPR
jgi:hypothetical protein